VYSLVVAKGGSKMQAVQTDAPDSKGGMGRAMMRFSTQGMALEAHGASMESLAHAIAQQLGSTVVDKTGLTGRYDYSLKWTPEPGTGPMMRVSEGGTPAGAEPAANTDPSIFTALQDQLGLKLVSQKEPVEVIVIDHIEQPSPN